MVNFDNSGNLGILPLRISFDSVTDAVDFLNHLDDYRDLLKNICFSNGFSNGNPQNVLSLVVKLNSDDSK